MFKPAIIHKSQFKYSNKTPSFVIGVSGSVNHLSDAKLDFVIKEVKTAAREISKRMGYLE